MGHKQSRGPPTWPSQEEHFHPPHATHLVRSHIRSHLSIRFPRIFPDSPKFISMNPSLNTFFCCYVSLQFLWLGFATRLLAAPTVLWRRVPPKAPLQPPGPRPRPPPRVRLPVQKQRLRRARPAAHPPRAHGVTHTRHQFPSTRFTLLLLILHIFPSSGKVTYMIPLPTIFALSIGMYARCISQCALTTKLRINFDSQHVPPPILHLPASICLGFLFY